MNTLNCRGALLCLFLFFTPMLLRAQQLKLGASPSVIEKSALLELNSDKQGLLLPRISNYTVAPLNAAPDGMLIYYVPDKLLYIRKNGVWRKLVDETSAITSVNGQTGPVVNLTTSDISESVNLYYTDARARAAFSAGTGINLTGAGVISALNSSAIWNASQLQGRNIAATAPANNDVLSWDATTSTWLPKAVTSGGSGSVTSVGLSLPSSVFNISNSPVTSSGTLTGAFANQAQRQVFASPLWSAGAPSFRALDALDIPNIGAEKITSGVLPTSVGGTGLNYLGGATNVLRVKSDGSGLEWSNDYVQMTSAINMGGDVSGSGNFYYINTTLANAGTAGTYTKVTTDAKGRVTFGTTLADTDIPNLDAAKITSGIFPPARGGTGLTYIGSAGQSIRINSGGTGFEYYTPAALPSMTVGSVPFAGTGGTLTQNNANLFWDNTNNRLGLGTNTPNNTLEVAGTVAASGLSGLRLTGLGAATLQSSLPNVLSVNSNGDVVVTSNAAANNWLITGNAGVNAATQFLGTVDDNKMVIKSNNSSFLEFARRATLGLVQDYDDYRDNDEKVTLLRSALQFDVPSTVEFYKPKMWTTADGNFRMKGPSAGTDYFEFGATGTANNGGFEFIIGDDGNEPIVFKSYYFATPSFTEIMRLQSGNVGIGLAGATPAKRLHVDANNDAIRLANLASSGTGNPLVINATGDVKQTTALNGVSIGATTRSSGAFTTLAGAKVNISITAAVTNDLAIGNSTFIRIAGTSVGNFMISGIAAGVDGQIITIYNSTGSNMSILHQNTASSAANRIISNTGGTIATTGVGCVTLIYSQDDSRWIVTSSAL